MAQLVFCLHEPAYGVHKRRKSRAFLAVIAVVLTRAGVVRSGDNSPIGAVWYCTNRTAPSTED